MLKKSDKKLLYRKSKIYILPKLRNGIVSAVKKRITAQYPFDCQKRAFERAVFRDRLDRILRACRRIPTTRTKIRRDRLSVKPNERQYRFFHVFLPSGTRARPFSGGFASAFAVLQILPRESSAAPQKQDCSFRLKQVKTYETLLLICVLYDFSPHCFLLFY